MDKCEISGPKRIPQSGGSEGFRGKNPVIGILAPESESFFSRDGHGEWAETQQKNEIHGFYGEELKKSPLPNFSVAFIMPPLRSRTILGERMQPEIKVPANVFVKELFRSFENVCMNNLGGGEIGVEIIDEREKDAVTTRARIPICRFSVLMEDGHEFRKVVFNTCGEEARAFYALLASHKEAEVAVHWSATKKMAQTRV